MAGPERGVGVIGAGTMGVGIAYVFAAAGFETAVVEPDETRAAGLRKVLATQARGGLDRGKLTEAESSALPARVHRLASVAELPAELELIVESVPERHELKRRVLAEAEQREPALLATNTSSISIAELARGLRRPEAFLGMHFFNRDTIAFELGARQQEVGEHSKQGSTPVQQHRAAPRRRP